eukprot:CAMPEP_0179408608 /NCGR_PEP_ID=MMETSP0799-20121207/2198_1 /TAXON_ID=46947 /ORGANISM="Geminigera cryophila, Strain CCMP2564" /LENGTH=35 /DNA_ID= /DNA_START= /DNA_END= /DNA_ORIENTATION=
MRKTTNSCPAPTERVSRMILTDVKDFIVTNNLIMR